MGALQPTLHCLLRVTESNNARGSVASEEVQLDIRTSLRDTSGSGTSDASPEASANNEKATNSSAEDLDSTPSEFYCLIIMFGD